MCHRKIEDFEVTLVEAGFCYGKQSILAQNMFLKHCPFGDENLNVCFCKSDCWDIAWHVLKHFRVKGFILEFSFSTELWLLGSLSLWCHTKKLGTIEYLCIAKIPAYKRRWMVTIDILTVLAVCLGFDPKDQECDKIKTIRSVYMDLCWCRCMVCIAISNRSRDAKMGFRDSTLVHLPQYSLS